MRAFPQRVNYDERCSICLSVEDIKRQTLNFYRMRLLCVPAFQPVSSGSHTFKGTNKALRDWVNN